MGKSTQTFRKRMAGYLSPGPTSTTNIRNNKRIRELLAKRVAVDVYVLPDNGLMRYGAFHLNLAAGLEDSIIAELAPEWNFNGQRLAQGQRERETTDRAPMAGLSPHELECGASAPEPTASFEFTLQPTYWNQGFFNGGVASSTLLGADGDTIEIFFRDEAQPVLGTINRTATSNGSPRIFGGPALRGRFQTLPQMTPMVVEVLSPTSIRIRATTRKRALQVPNDNHERLGE
ncbi:GIY-YIG nuclease family protein [Burkholderia sp. LS-044]|uniref:GIY-YIG nuclease family protein n=1 Tax=Burkholderia sp. LS-044 TaxID=1459967 RepID=UPI001B3BA4EF|nr:GIY-YIG nuclease family protein [Burkholderia sp. LS-044]